MSCVRATSSVRIAVARDAAFCFVYDDNLRLLREAGAELVEFSPLADEGLPAETAGIYLPGGYPELFAEALAANGAMREAIRQAVEAGMPVYAECGGFIYLTEGVVSVAGAQHAAPLQEFVGIFPVTTRMLPRRKALGYREVEFTADTVLGRAGTVARGHEFHYSEMAELPPQVDSLAVYHQALAEKISIAPGPIFSPKQKYRNFIRLNCGNPWSDKVESAVKRLGRIIAAHSARSAS